MFDKIVTACPEEYAESVTFGGTTLYATEEGILWEAVERIEEAIDKVTGPHLTLIKNAVLKLVRESFSESPSNKAISAVFGRMLRLGRMKAISCMTVNVRAYSVFINAGNAEKLAEMLEQIEHLLRTSRLVSVRTVWRKYFPDKGYGTWATSQYLLQHLAFLGHAVYQDKDSFYWPVDIENAICTDRS